MTPFRPKQGWWTLLVLALYAPVVLSVGSRDLAERWTGLSFVWFMVFLLAAFVALSWVLSRMAFDSGDDGAPGGDAP